MTENASGDLRFIIFLDPAALDPAHLDDPGEPGANGVSNPLVRDEPAEAFERLIAELGAAVVLACDRSPHEARDRLRARGLRIPFAQPWHTDQSAPDPAAAVMLWLERNGARSALVLDCSGPDVALDIWTDETGDPIVDEAGNLLCMPRISVPASAYLTVEFVSSALALIKPRPCAR